MARKWYVVCDGFCSEPDEPDNAVWTVSLDPEHPGWTTDSGCSGYGLTKNLAQFLCDAANEKEERETKSK